MQSFVSRLNISRRLAIAFVLAALLPTLIIALMGFYYTSQLNGRGSVTDLSSTALSRANDLAKDFHSMYASTKTAEAQVLYLLGTSNGTIPAPTTSSNAFTPPTPSETLANINSINVLATQF